MQSIPGAESTAPPETPRDGTYDLRRVVGADMDSIFALLPRQSQAATPPPAAKVPAPAKGFRAYRWRILFVLLVAVLMLAAAMAFLPNFSHGPKEATPPVARPIAMTAIPITTEAAPVSPHPAKPAPPATAPAKHPERVAVATPHRARAPKEDRAAPSRSERQTSARCRSGDRAWCQHDRALAADEALRDAYADAVRAGVRRSAMVDVRRDWSRLRKRANKDPAALIDGYADLTGNLRRLTRERAGR